MATISNGYGLVKRRLFVSLSCLALLVSSYCYGPVYPIDISGDLIEVEGPLLITSYTEGMKLLSFVRVKKKIGFLNIGTLDISDTCFESNYTWSTKPGEQKSFYQSVGNQQLSYAVDDGFITNRRVIVHAEGRTGRKTIRFIKGIGKEYSYKDFGVRLGLVFINHDIKASQIDLILPDGKDAGAGVIEGLKMTGLKDFTVRCFKGDTLKIKKGCIHIEGFDHQPDRKEDIDPEPFFISGEVKSTRPGADSLIETFIDGNPDLIKPIEVSPPSVCSQ